jgi:large subunit ribosomal protein L4
MKAAALRGALSDRARHDRVHVVSEILAGDTPSSKSALATLRAVTERTHVLAVVDRDETTAWKSLRNLSEVHVLSPDQLNTYDVLVSDDVVFTAAALNAFLAGPPTGKSATASATSTEAAAAEEVESA